MKITLMLFLAQETLVKPITRSNCEKKSRNQRPIHIIARSPEKNPNY